MKLVRFLLILTASAAAMASCSASHRTAPAEASRSSDAGGARVVGANAEPEEAEPVYVISQEAKVWRFPNVP